LKIFRCNVDQEPRAPKYPLIPAMYLIYLASQILWHTPDTKATYDIEAKETYS
jgi:hypothetical protein